MKKLILAAGLSILIASTACYAATQPQDSSLVVQLALSNTSDSDASVCFQDVNTKNPFDSLHCTSDWPDIKLYQNLVAPPILQLSASREPSKSDPSCQKDFPLKGIFGRVDIVVTFKQNELTNCQVIDESHN